MLEPVFLKKNDFFNFLDAFSFVGYRSIARFLRKKLSYNAVSGMIKNSADAK